MPQPRHIYASTLSRRQRSWGRPRRRTGLLAARMLLLSFTAALVLTAVAMGRLPG